MPTGILKLAVEVRQCPLGSGARGGGPAVPTGIWSSRWRSGSAHWDLEIEEEDAAVRTEDLDCGGDRGEDAEADGGGEQL